MFYVLIGLMQLGTRCSDGSCQAHEDLIAGFSAIESVAVAFDFCTCRNSFANDLLKCFARDVFHDLHPREQSHAIFRAKDTTPTHSRCSAYGSAGRQKCRVCPWHTDRSPRTRTSAADPAVMEV